MLGYEDDAILGAVSIDPLEVLIQVFAPEIGFFEFVVKDAHAFIPEDVRELCSYTPILSRKRQHHVVFVVPLLFCHLNSVRLTFIFILILYSVRIYDEDIKKSRKTNAEIITTEIIKLTVYALFDKLKSSIR